MDNIREWWNQTSSRDQIYLLICGMCLALFIMYMGIYKPVTGMRDSQLKRNQAQLGALERVKQMAAQWKEISQSGARSSGPTVDSLVQSSLSNNGVRASSIDGSGRSGVRVRVDEAPFENVAAWLYELEVVKGLRISDLSVASGKRPGSVAVNLRVKKG